MSDNIDYGPLQGLIGTWQGDKGLDVAPEPDGKEENPYDETLVFVGIGNVTNAETQTLAVVRYHQVVRRKSNGEVFHDEVGYWMWDAQESVVMHSLAIPRAVSLLAGGVYSDPTEAGQPITLEVSAKLGDEKWGDRPVTFHAAERADNRVSPRRHHRWRQTSLRRNHRPGNLRHNLRPHRRKHVGP